VHVTSFFLNLPIALVTALAWGFLAFLVGRRVHRHATIDVFWGAGFLVVYVESVLVSLAMNHGARHVWWLHEADVSRWVLLGAVALWSLRLSIHLAIRQRGAKEDSRYVAIMAGAKGRHETWYALKMIYGLQGLLLWFVSIPLQWAAFSAHFNWLVVLGVVIALIGVFFEATGDEQLRRFIANPSNAGTTMNRGLWRYTRHPNYFGDATVWFGFYVIALATPWGFLTVLSPLTMWWLLTSLSGKPMLEKKLSKTRAGYEEYVATTSSFFPLPPRKTSKV
jgi:steroid 5-alpha reductase family enzyme